MVIQIMLLIILALYTYKNKDIKILSSWLQLIYEDLQKIEIEPSDLLKNSDGSQVSIICNYKDLLRSQLKAGRTIIDRMDILLSAIDTDIEVSRLRLSILSSLYTRIAISTMASIILRVFLVGFSFMSVSDCIVNLVGVFLVGGVFILSAYLCHGSFFLTSSQWNEVSAQIWMHDLFFLGSGTQTKIKQILLIKEKERRSGVSRSNEKLDCMRRLYQNITNEQKARLKTFRDLIVLVELLISTITFLCMNFYPLQMRLHLIEAVPFN